MQRSTIIGFGERVPEATVASLIIRNCSDDPEDEFHSHSDEARQSYQSQLQFLERGLTNFKSCLVG